MTGSRSSQPISANSAALSRLRTTYLLRCTGCASAGVATDDLTRKVHRVAPGLVPVRWPWPSPRPIAIGFAIVATSGVRRDVGRAHLLHGGCCRPHPGRRRLPRPRWSTFTADSTCAHAGSSLVASSRPRPPTRHRGYPRRNHGDETTPKLLLKRCGNGPRPSLTLQERGWGLSAPHPRCPLLKPG